MSTIRIFNYQDKMKDLINENNILLMVMSRFGIPLGFANKDVQTVCDEYDVDCDTFLAVSNFITFNKLTHSISLQSLIGYLKKAHNYFLNFNLPTIRRRLIEALDCCSEFNEISLLIIKFYDNYATEVKHHMQYEDETVFSYVENLMKGHLSNKYNIRLFEARHNHIEKKLKELKEILIRYYPQQENEALNAVLLDIMNCEQDLISHCQIEDELFFQEVLKLEESLIKSPKANYTNDSLENKEDEPVKIQSLSDREKEIIRCIAKGMTYKDIADHLCLSVHTINTHRRNICSKLEIHSAAGITIFAIINKLVKMNDIKQIK